jgi:hypothetical protein
MSERITFIITLDCWHSSVFKDPAPVIGDQIWCMKCQAYQVVRSAPAEYRIRCQKCTYSRTFGTSQINAEIAAAKHRMKRNSHTVLLMNGRRVVKRYQTDPASALTLGSETPPPAVAQCDQTPKTNRT